MVYPSTTKIRVYAGPSLLSEHPVVALTIPISVDTGIQTSVVDSLIGSALPGGFTRSLNSQNGTLMCSEVTFALTKAMLAASGMPELSVNILKDLDHQSVVIARYYDPTASLMALQASFKIASEISRGGESLLKDGRRVAGFFTQSVNRLTNFRPDILALSLIRIAKVKDIPFRIFASTSHTWLFGHGTKSVQFAQAITSNDGVPGYFLTRNKAQTNKLVKDLGFPTTRSALAVDLGPAKNIARSIGYPVVVKPVGEGGGRGVTAHITQDSEFEAAFKKAAATSTQAVLVENHVAGNDYRITIFGGRFAWAVKRMPAEIIGTGKQSIRELISKENKCREQIRETQFFLKSIVIDEELIRVLRKQGYSLDDCPPENTSVLLNSVANISTGGTLEDCTSIIHPDNVAMAECLARSFRLDSVGVDLITPDIRKSWRECECAIIEINSTPAFFNDVHAKLILERKFAGGSDGRIPIILALNCEMSVHDHVVSELSANRVGIGYVNADTCKIDSHARGGVLAEISDKVNALLFDPVCSSLLVGLTTSDIEVGGLPVDRCAVTIISTKFDVPERIRNIIEAASGMVVEVSDIDDFKQERYRDIFSKLNET